MNTFSISGIVIGVASLVMSAWVYLANKTSRANQCFAFYCIAVMIWGFGGALIGITKDPNMAITLWRITHVGVIFIPVLLYHFVILFLGLHRPKSVFLVYLIGATFLAANLTPYFIAHMRWVFGQFYYDSPPGVLYPFFALFFLATVLVCHIDLWKFIRRSSGLQQLRVQWFFTAAAVGYSGGITCFLPVFGLDVYPYGNFTVPLYTVIMGYSIVRHQLLGIEVVINRTAVFTAVYAMVLGAPLLGALAWQPDLERVLGEKWWVWLWIVVAVLATVAHYANLYFQGKAEARLLREQRKYQRTLLAASTGMTRIKDLKRLLSLIVHMLTKEVRVTHAGVFLWDAENENYLLKSSRDHQQLIPGLRVGKDDPLLDYLKHVRDAIVYEELNAQLAGQSGNERASPKLPPPTILETMKRIGGAVVVPSFAEDQLLGFFVLGEKKTGQIFSPDDLAVFVTLANQAAIAIENAMYFEELKTNEAYMIQSEKLATMGQLASGMAHEIHNPLTIISGESQLFLERLRVPPSLETPEERQKFIDEIKATLQSSVEEVARASDITRRILKFSRVSKEGFTAIEVKQLLDDTLALASYQHNMKAFEVTKDIPDGLPQIHGNVNQLQEVFLNLIVNACQAMGGKGRLALAAREVKVDHHPHVEITVTDTGPGIPPGKLLKIFDPFYTTKSNGTGLGLFVTQRIVKGHGGHITATSVVGTGTTFVLQLPVFKGQPAPAKS